MALLPNDWRKRPVTRYLIIGGSVYIFELVVIYVAEKLGAGPVLSVGISFWLGLIVSFLLQKMVTFRDKRLHHRVLIPQLVAFSVLVVWNFGFTLAVTALLSPFITAFFSRTLALGVTTIWNFYLYKTRIFRRDEEIPF